jgi:hypothetical protein
MFSLNQLYLQIQAISTAPWILSLIVLFSILCGLFSLRSKKLNTETPILESRWTYTAKEVFDFLGSMKPGGIALYQWTQVTLDGIFPLVYGILSATFIVLLYGKGVALLFILLPILTTLVDVGENLSTFILVSQFRKSTNIGLSSTTQIAQFFTRAKFILLSCTLFIIFLGGILKFRPFFFPFRIPIIFGTLLFSFPILANTFAAKLFQNLFFMRSAQQLIAITIGALMPALMVSFTVEEIFLKNPTLMSTEIQGGLIYIRYGLALLLTLPTWIFVWLRSKAELKSSLWLAGTMIGLGGGAAFIGVVIWVGRILEKFLIPNLFLAAKIPAIGEYISRLEEADFLGFALGITSIAIYILVMFLFKPGPNEDKLLPFLGESPALLYALLLIWMLTGILGMLTSNLDQFQIPVILTLIFLSGMMYLCFDVDHYFEVPEIKSPSTQDHLEKAKDFKTVIDNRLARQIGNEKTLVVVAASGGGIQAAGWTVRVLTGLQEEFGPAFTQSIGLISAVSGGSVGTMFFLDRFTPDGFPSGEDITSADLSEQHSYHRHKTTAQILKDIPAPQRQALVLEKIFQNATEDNLDAVGWGLVYPDFMRFLYPPFAGSKFNDRGYAIEKDWQVNMHKPIATLQNRRKQIFNGEIPVPVYNATLVEDGRRFLISPMTFLKDDAFLEDKNHADIRKALDFNTLFNHKNCQGSDSDPNTIYDLNVTTAARLSASFPYVSPVARNNGDFKFNYHVADGGYFDNSGMFTAIEWLDDWLGDFNEDLKIKRILILQINAYPEAEPPSMVKGEMGWFMEWIGPLRALYSVRNSTQASRNATELSLLEKRAKKKGMDVRTFSITFPSETAAESKKKFQQPLSWKLNKQQKRNLKLGWQEVIKGPAFAELKDVWKTQWKIPDQW